MLLSSPALFFETEHTSFWFFTIWDLWLLMMVLPLQVHLRGRLWTLQFYANKRAFLHEWRGVLGSSRAAATPYERIFPWVRRIRLHLCIVKILSVLPKLLASFINCTWHVMPKLFAKAVISVLTPRNSAPVVLPKMLQPCAFHTFLYQAKFKLLVWRLRNWEMWSEMFRNCLVSFKLCNI